MHDAEKCLQKLKDLYFSEAASLEELDGLSISFENWRFNIRKSNTESLVRLNIETKGDQDLLKKSRRSEKCYRESLN